MNATKILMTAMLSMVLGWTTQVAAQTIAGEYQVTVSGTNHYLDITPAKQPISATTTMQIEQEGEKVRVTMGSFASAFAATQFQGKVGNGLMSAVWWDQGHGITPDVTKVLWGEVAEDGLVITGKLMYARVAYRNEGPPGSPRLVPGWVEVEFRALKSGGGQTASQPTQPQTSAPAPPPTDAAVADDPNEEQIEDGKDFQQMAVAVREGRVRVQIRTYANWSFRPFQSLYFTGGEKGQVHVRLDANGFQVMGPTPGRRGMFTVPLAQGPVNQMGSDYSLEFPWTDAFGGSAEVQAWVFSQDGRDRLPDRGTLAVRNPNPPATPSQAAVVADPNEQQIEDGKDYRGLEIAQDGDRVQVRILTYADGTFRSRQSLYFTGGQHEQVHVAIQGDRFRVRPPR
ncbi:MAG: hypothetical protein O2954_05310 [bacterium]|nr:hypothetical protein [bacterium]